ncbi:MULTISPECIES: hypothetical protein [unclassified Acinetobacter]|uniref:hypothetical protein n=1 Tax=unclassified Acinetobacter TaxID=196816 RepID=UPI002935243E|nr:MULTISPECIES: hypothetical protein [unclassified Acinetobacter]WOE32764.1 hypothetical protein QSG84_06200 [Acinetobacter sp. SAAs470]WOE38241.1 hypothetical protein QSG86_15255 [Acinetobacter sp. SAAs474]
MITTFTTTFNDLFGSTFRRWNPPKDGIMETEIVVSSLAGDALGKFLEYCKQHGYKSKVEEVKDNLILLTVYLK